MWMSRSGLANKASTCEAWAVRGVRARFLVGRLERGSAEVGMDSGMGSDMLVEVAKAELLAAQRLGGNVQADSGAAGEINHLASEAAVALAFGIGNR